MNNDNVKDYLAKKIQELQGQLREIVDAENKAATNMLVGKCFRIERETTDNEGVKRVELYSFSRVLEADKGNVLMFTLRLSSDAISPVVETRWIDHKSADRWLNGAAEMTMSEWAYQVRSRMLELMRKATGENMILVVNEETA